MIEQQEDRKISIGQVAKSRMFAWGDNHANFQKAVSEKGVEEQIQKARPELIAWANQSEELSIALSSYIGENEEEFSEQFRRYLLRRFVEATAIGVIFDGKSFEQVESETINSQSWLDQMIQEAVQELKSLAEEAAAKISLVSMAVMSMLGAGLGICLDEDEDEDEDEDDGEEDDPGQNQGVKPPYSDF